MHEPPLHPGFSSIASRARAVRPRVALGLAALAVTALGAAAAAPPALRPPRDPAAIERVLAEGPHAGECERCHSMHGKDQPTVYPNALVGPNDNTFCVRCHETPWAGGSFAGEPLYLGTGHGSSPSMVWPGPAPPTRTEIDAATKCLNCHDPHGWTDSQGAIPMLTLQREEKLCLACHDGSPAGANVAADLAKPYRHPTTVFSGRHAGPGESQPSDFGATPLNQRHAECEDCHNPHVSRAQAGGLEGTPDASKATLGVSRVAVTNGPAGTRPLYTFLAAADTLTLPNAEYQLCFKCHSSWTNPPSGQTDFAVVLNPANPSFHPVEETGRNPGISISAFTPGWGPTSITRCTSCHGSDFGSESGPHGSVNQHLLRRPSPAGAGPRDMSRDELCFSCHSYDVYADPGSPAQTLAASRFNDPVAGGGHADHVGRNGVPCWSCHVTHGSTTLPFLLVVGRVPGLVAYTSTGTGGTCTPSCHAARSYTVSYAR